MKQMQYCAQSHQILAPKGHSARQLNKMNCKRLFYISFVTLIHFAKCNEKFDCPKEWKGKSCQWIEAKKPSIVVRTTAGRVGNILFDILVLLAHKVSFTVV